MAGGLVEQEQTTFQVFVSCISTETVYECLSDTTPSVFSALPTSSNGNTSAAIGALFTTTTPESFAPSRFVACTAPIRQYSCPSDAIVSPAMRIISAARRRCNAPGTTSSIYFAYNELHRIKYVG